MSVQPYLPRVIIFLMPMYILDVHYKDLVVILQCVWWNKDQILDLILCDFSYSVTPPSVSRGDKRSNICYLRKISAITTASIKGFLEETLRARAHNSEQIQQGFLNSTITQRIPSEKTDKSKLRLMNSLFPLFKYKLLFTALTRNR